jgi:hypothetical protein
MRKPKLLTLLVTTIALIFIVSGFAFADDVSADDWMTNSGNTYVTSGNVGIGMETPGTNLDIYNSQDTSGLASVLRLESYTNTSNEGPGIDFVSRWIGAYPNWVVGRIGSIYDTSGGSNRGALVFYTNNDNNANEGISGTSEKMRILGNGNVGIGTTNPGSYKLAVEGKIGAREVVVTEASWADHVFEESYNLPSLNNVESYIKENKHLPDIPSAKEVEEEGLSIAEMMKKQMQKIEELMLYVIQLQKKNNELEARLAVVEKDK